MITNRVSVLRVVARSHYPGSRNDTQQLSHVANAASTLRVAYHTSGRDVRRQSTSQRGRAKKTCNHHTCTDQTDHGNRSPRMASSCFRSTHHRHLGHLLQLTSVQLRQSHNIHFWPTPATNCNPRHHLVSTAMQRFICIRARCPLQRQSPLCYH